jgi:AraC-like DNA-binding protein
MRKKLQFMFERLDSRFDVLTQVLQAVHLGSALSSRIVMRPPWALHFAAIDRRAGFHVVVGGQCATALDGDRDAVALGPGDVVVFPHGAGHVLGDKPETPSVEVHDLVADMPPGGRVAIPGGDRGDATTVLCGSYSFAADGANPLLRGLPDLLHIPSGKAPNGPLAAAVALLAAEADALEPGTAMAIDRLVDILFVYALRAWISLQDGAGAHSWFGALQDPAVGPAVRAIHDLPAHSWTIETLAERAGLSRAAFARRFHQTIGEPPLAYLTRWRMTVAADLLKQGRRIAEVAHIVGYDNEFAFAKAFKRVRGIAPGLHRRRYAGSSQR